MHSIRTKSVGSSKYPRRKFLHGTKHRLLLLGPESNDSNVRKAFGPSTASAKVPVQSFSKRGNSSCIWGIFLKTTYVQHCTGSVNRIHRRTPYPDAILFGQFFQIWHIGATYSCTCYRCDFVHMITNKPHVIKGCFNLHHHRFLANINWIKHCN